MIVFSKDWQAFDFESLEIGDSIVSLSPSKFQPEEGKKASDAIITFEGGQVRYRFDGGDPSPSLDGGHLGESGLVLTLKNPFDIAQFKAIRAGSENGRIQVTYRR
ncbi:MAG: hypothetical protein DRP55_03085 [Spirochaetes bacterium]|nr:hypothetical protein [Deltaproteobacteria bacterium]RKY02275.1 MAG: hypothetical protein DRP55_03085 [Spirochaetota bacterium]